MTFDNPSFFEQYRDVVIDKLYIGSSPDDLQREISNNLWSISANQDDINQLTLQNWETFFVAVMENRTRQIRESGKGGMIFYMWFDEQTAQIRFCLISAFHDQLPFGSTIEWVDQPKIIIEQFMNSPYHDGIPFRELIIEDIDEFEESPDPVNLTLVYQTILS